MSTASIVSALIEGAVESVGGEHLGLTSPPTEAPPSSAIPTSLSELNRQLSRTYDLSVTAAGRLGLPIIGSVSGGFERRVIVLERTAFREVPHGQAKYQYGYAIRLAITANRVTADMKLSLPFLAASAETGRIEGKWTLQVVGLAGPKIDAAILPPTDLNVETFVLAKQSLVKLINAVNDKSTTFSAARVGILKDSDLVEKELRIAVARAYALAGIARGRSASQAIGDLDVADGLTRDTIKDTYRELAGIADADEKPSDSSRAAAKQILGDVKVEPR